MALRIEHEPKLNAPCLFHRRDDLKTDAGFADIEQPAAIVGLELNVSEAGGLGARSAAALGRGGSLRPGRLGSR